LQHVRRVDRERQDRPAEERQAEDHHQGRAAQLRRADADVEGQPQARERQHHRERHDPQRFVDLVRADVHEQEQQDDAGDDEHAARVP
jgi:hypothetical protein